MKLGEKIKKIRKDKKMTQAALAGNKITRNMISRIEGGSATPSFDTLTYLAERLRVPISYLLSEDDDLFIYEKRDKISSIMSAFAGRDYKRAISIINEISGLDNELAYILTISYFELGKSSVIKGALNTALDCFARCKDASTKTVYNTEHIMPQLMIYEAIATNIQSPLLEFDSKKYENGLKLSFDYEFYKYLLQDLEYSYIDPVLINHTAARIMIKERKYLDAISKLTEISLQLTSKAYNSYVLYGVYYDLEMCYKEIRDFENAYKLANKRMKLVESFKS